MLTADCENSSGLGVFANGSKGRKTKSAPIEIGRAEGSSVLARISGFRSMKRLGVFVLPLDGILVHRRLPPSILSGCHQSNLLVPIYTPGW